MSIYVGGEKAKFYRGDYGPAQLYKGDVKIAGYTDHEKVGTSIRGIDTYSDALNLTIEGKSEQTVTEQGKNLFDEERILPTQGWVKQSDGSFFVSDNIIPFEKVLWENTDGYTGQLALTIQYRRNEAGNRYVGTLPVIRYKDGSDRYMRGTTGVEWLTDALLSDSAKPIERVYWSYGTGAPGTYIKELLIAKSDTILPYEPFVPPPHPPDSPSPDCPSPIRSSENFDVVSCGHDLSTATTAHVADTLRSVGDVADSIEVSGGKVEVVRRIGVLEFGGRTAVSQNAPGEKRLFFTKIQGLMVVRGKYSDGFCTHYKNVYNAETVGCSFGAWDTVLYLNFSKDTTVAGIKNYFAAQAQAGTPVTCQYQLATPTRTDITTTPLGQALLAMRTYPHYTQVYTNATLPPMIRAKIKEMEL